MNRLIFWGGLAGVAACFTKPTFATITPDYGYVDGCTDILLQGHHLGTTATAQIGGKDVVNLAPAQEDSGRPEHAQDVGFLYSGQTPPFDDPAGGWADVTLTVDGEALTKTEAFYYSPCPASFWIDSFTLPGEGGYYGYTTTLAGGESIAFAGCGLDADVTVRFMAHATVGTTTTGGATVPGTNTTVDACGNYGLVEAATTTLVSDCSSAYVHAVVPTLPAGTYDVWLQHTDGTTYTGGVFPHTADTGATCVPITINVGGAK